MSKKGGMQYMPKISFPRRWLTQGDNHNFKGSPQECWVWAPQQALQTKNPTLGRQVFKPSGIGVQWGLHMGESEGYRIKMSLLKGAWKISVALSETAQFSSVQLLIRVRLFATPWIATRQASLSITSSRSLLKLMSIELVMSSTHLILCHPFLVLPSIFPSIRVFSNELALRIRSHQSIGASASASLLPMTIQGWFPLGLPGLISLQSRSSIS